MSAAPAPARRVPSHFVLQRRFRVLPFAVQERGSLRAHSAPSPVRADARPEPVCAPARRPSNRRLAGSRPAAVLAEENADAGPGPAAMASLAATKSLFQPAQPAGARLDRPTDHENFRRRRQPDRNRAACRQRRTLHPACDGGFSDASGRGGALLPQSALRNPRYPHPVARGRLPLARPRRADARSRRLHRPLRGLRAAPSCDE